MIEIEIEKRGEITGGGGRGREGSVY